MSDPVVYLLAASVIAIGAFISALLVLRRKHTHNRTTEIARARRALSGAETAADTANDVPAEAADLIVQARALLSGAPDARTAQRAATMAAAADRLIRDEERDG